MWGKMLSINKLQCGFGGESRLIEELSFDVTPGQLRLVQGPSGCGKSTLLSVISGTVPAGLKWSGDIKLAGRVLNGVPAVQRNIGLLFQDPLLFPHLSVGDNLAFGLARVKGSTTKAERQRAVEEALDVAAMTGFGDRDPATLSGGQAARIGLMRSLIAEPDVLLMDEAFSALDPELRQQFGGFVKDAVREKNIPALLVSHDQGDSQFASGDIIRL